MKKNLLILIYLVAVTFILNLIWENLQMPLYTSYVWHAIWGINCVKASLGDILIVLLMYIPIAVYKNKFAWFKNYTKTDIIIFLGIGLLIAIGFEKFALATNRWQYSSFMPIIPFINVGLSPILQMLILPFVTLKIVNTITK